MTTTDARNAVRERLRVCGVVQGVGFRPFVHRLATDLALAGHVGNDSAGVFIEIEGSPDAVTEFHHVLRSGLPPLARIDRVDVVAVAARGETEFAIVDSEVAGGAATFLPPDIAVCDDCLRELFDPTDRRHRYPFITCTNCGPRFTITRRLPYDRPNTTMAQFPLCPACAAEYHDPGDRRFHAQPLACSACGPRLRFRGATDEFGNDDAVIAATLAALALGRLVAIKGLGGYHVAADPTNDDALQELRRRKHRPDKPFAVMARDLAVAARFAEIDDDEAAALASAQRPIVLLRARRNSGLSRFIAPESPLVGIMLPYTPLHHLLFRPAPGAGDAPDVLLMTSGNLSDEPICYDDADAASRLAGIVDAWVVHDRAIHVPCDDSVVRVVAGEPLPVRRSRGYAPLPIRLPFTVPPVLAVGGDLKSAFAVARGTDCWMSQHIGDLGTAASLGALERSIAQFCEVYGTDPVLVAADAHPAYQSTAWAARTARATVTTVHHHHAHVAALMAEHALGPDAQVIAFAFDGTGYGTDATIWGGEVLVGGYRQVDRVAHLRPIALPGGDAAIRLPRRCALAHLHAAGIAWAEDLAPVADSPPDERRVLARQLDRGRFCVPTTSMGRLFDAVSSLLGIRHAASYEAQAAIELEYEAAGDETTRYAFGTDSGTIDQTPVLAQIVADLRLGVPTATIAAGFHEAVAAVVVERARALAAATGIEQIALTGGVFQNVRLLVRARALLAAAGFDVLYHRLVPTNDGGLALGQLAVAAVRHGGPADV